MGFLDENELQAKRRAKEREAEDKAALAARARNALLTATNIQKMIVAVKKNAESEYRRNGPVTLVRHTSPEEMGIEPWMLNAISAVESGRYSTSRKPGEEIHGEVESRLLQEFKKAEPRTGRVRISYQTRGANQYHYGDAGLYVEFNPALGT